MGLMVNLSGLHQNENRHIIKSARKLKTVYVILNEISSSIPISCLACLDSHAKKFCKGEKPEYFFREAL